MNLGCNFLLLSLMLSLLTVGILPVLAQPLSAGPEASISNQTSPQPSPPMANVLETGPLALDGTVHLRDPFSRMSSMGKAVNLESVPELERFELSSFRLVGVITGFKKNKALLAGPTGKMYVVSENMKIGQKKGTIKKISVKAVAVEEKILNLLGQEERVETEIRFVEKKQDEKKAASPSTSGHGVMPGSSNMSGNSHVRGEL